MAFRTRSRVVLRLRCVVSTPRLRPLPIRCVLRTLRCVPIALRWVLIVLRCVRIAPRCVHLSRRFSVVSLHVGDTGARSSATMAAAGAPCTRSSRTRGAACCPRIHAALPVASAAHRVARATALATQSCAWLPLATCSPSRAPRTLTPAARQVAFVRDTPARAAVPDPLPRTGNLDPPPPRSRRRHLRGWRQHQSRQPGSLPPSSRRRRSAPTALSYARRQR